MSNSLASPQVKKRDMRSPRFSNEENWQKLLLASTFLIGFSAVVFSTSRREREARHDLLKADVLRKESIDENANTIHVMRRILSLKNKEDDDELKAKRRREEVERLVREELERKRESGKVKVLEE
jgi:hypothetical protein|tara:strand:- start:179 stop:553 length:375 start_codon:yes stop_codon:yes gene_type:complete